MPAYESDADWARALPRRSDAWYRKKGMNREQATRLAELQQAWCSYDLIHALLGLDLAGDKLLESSFRTWASRFRGTSDVIRPNRVDRHALETYLGQNGLVSRKWAAVYLGLSAEKMTEIVNRLESNGVSTQLASAISEQIVRQRDSALLFRAFTTLRHRTFGDHSRMCRAVHQAVRDELGIDVDPVLCVTSAILEPDEPDIAAAFDAITLDPVGLRYQVWLETGKPVNLHPYVCSLRFYATNQADLHDLVMKGSEPEAVDPRLVTAA